MIIFQLCPALALFPVDDKWSSIARRQDETPTTYDHISIRVSAPYSEAGWRTVNCSHYCSFTNENPIAIRPESMFLKCLDRIIGMEDDAHILQQLKRGIVNGFDITYRENFIRTNHTILIRNDLAF